MINVMKLIFSKNIKHFWLIVVLLLIFLTIVYPNFIISLKLVDQTIKNLGFNIKKVEIIGNKHVSKLEILNNLQFKNCKNLFCLDMKKSKKEIENINWINSVKIKIILPSKLLVTLKEEEPYFILENNKELLLLNAQGKKISNINNATTNFKDLLILKGVGVEREIKQLLNIFSIDEAISDKITEAKYVSNRRWSLVYNSSLIIELPEENPEEAFFKIGELEEKYNFLSNRLKKIDLRVSDRMIIKIDTNNFNTEESNI